MKPAGAVPLRVAPCTLRFANQFVHALHRHHKPVRGCRFCLQVVDAQGAPRGVAICGRPVAQETDQDLVLEVSRCCTDGTPNAPSMLYAAAASAAKALGFWKVQTFILETEPGTSLKAAGFMQGPRSRGGSWNRPARGGGRREDQPQDPKVRWERVLNPGAKSAA